MKKDCSPSIPYRNMISNIEVVTTTEKSFIELLLSDYEELLKKGEEALSDNYEYMKLTELRFLIKKYDIVTLCFLCFAH